MPKRVILIAAVTVDGYIARHHKEITTWSRDLHLFKEQTMGSPVILGSNTFDTLSKELNGRENIVVHRDDNPVSVLSKISSNTCFVIGGGRTYLRFIKYITHIYVTPHPYVFGDGISLFYEKHKIELKLKFEELVDVDRDNGIFQYQYSVEGLP